MNKNLSNLLKRFDNHFCKPLFSKANKMSMVGVAGFEPTTPCPPDKCANRAALHSDWALL